MFARALAENVNPQWERQHAEKHREKFSYREIVLSVALKTEEGRCLFRNNLAVRDNDVARVKLPVYRRDFPYRCLSCKAGEFAVVPDVEIAYYREYLVDKIEIALRNA